MRPRWRPTCAPRSNAIWRFWSRCRATNYCASASGAWPASAPIPRASFRMSRAATRHPPDRRGAFSVSRLQQRLRELIVPLRDAQLCVAYSGGADSTALLAALVRLRGRCGFRLRALHVNHQLHADAGHWAMQATAMAGRLGVPIQVLCVDIATAGLSVE